jgi:hypothetical protein
LDCIADQAPGIKYIPAKEREAVTGSNSAHGRGGFSGKRERMKAIDAENNRDVKKADAPPEILHRSMEPKYNFEDQPAKPS